MNSKIRLLTLNIGGRRDLAGLPAIIVEYNLDIIFLQEIVTTSEELDRDISKFGFNCNVNSAEDSSKPGTAIIWRSSLQISDCLNIIVGRAQLLVLGGVILLNIYAPSGSNLRHERNLFFGRDILRIYAMYPAASYVLSGDFNAILEPIDVENGSGFSQKNCPPLADLVKVKKMLDLFRYFYPTKAEYTFHRPNVSASRLDRVYVSETLVNKVTTVKHVASLSDHCGVFIEIYLNCEKVKLTLPRKTETYWKLNCSILDDEDFMSNFSELWRNMLSEQEAYQNVADWWDCLVKPSIKLFCQHFSTQRRRRLRDTKKYLFAYLKIALNDKNWEEVVRVKKELTMLLHNEAQGSVIRSRFQNNADLETASIYHANKEMKNAEKNSLSKLKIEGQVEGDNGLIENEVIRFFNALFNGYHNSNLVNTGRPFVPDFSNLDQFLDGLGTLADEDRDNMEQEITMDELEYVVKNSANNKSPGLDGLCYELYKKTWPLIKDDLLSVFQCQLGRKRLLASNKEGVTRLCSKVEGVPAVDELRPITLLNCDYKLLSKCLVLRMRPKLPSVIKSGQLCTVGSKNILFGVSNIISSILAIKQKKGKACLISLDFFKAYDRVMLSFLLKVIGAMNFGSDFIAWIAMLHKGARTRFILCFLTKAIDVQFSIRQGDPIAMLLYIIYVEPLLLLLERKLTGLHLPFVTEVLEAYCDDINIMTCSF